jgi:hypothetical protein
MHTIVSSRKWPAAALMLPTRGVHATISWNLACTLILPINFIVSHESGGMLRRNLPYHEEILCGLGSTGKHTSSIWFPFQLQVAMGGTISLAIAQRT